MATPSCYLHFNQPDTSTTFLDDSGKIWTGTGSPEILKRSLYLDGSSYISTPSDASFDFSSGTPFTIDCWVSLQATDGLIALQGNTELTIVSFAILFISGQIGCGNNSGSFPAITLPNVNWHHIAFVWDGTYANSYLDGASVGSPTTGLSFVISSDNLVIGNGVAGYIDDFRIIKHALWTSNFIPTPRTGPISTTLHFTEPDNSTTFTDESEKLWTIVGNSKIMDAALYLDGTGLIYTSQSDDFSFSGDFTIDFWIKSQENTIYHSICGTGYVAGWKIGFDSANGLEITNANSIIINNVFGINNSWNHVAFVRYGNTLKCYFNGTLSGTAVYSSAIVSAEPLALGLDTDTSISFAFIGSIDDFRIVKQALWLTDFTPTPRTTPIISSGLYPYTIVVT